MEEDLLTKIIYVFVQLICHIGISINVLNAYIQIISIPLIELVKVVLLEKHLIFLYFLVIRYIVMDPKFLMKRKKNVNVQLIYRLK